VLRSNAIATSYGPAEKRPYKILSPLPIAPRKRYSEMNSLRRKSL
jgi:hypothetical protein